MHSIVKDQDSSPNLTARAVICMDMVLPTQEAATELVQSIANSAENPLSIGSVSTIDISRFGNTLGSAAMECSRIVRTVTPYEEDGGVMRCRSCPLSATLIDAGLMNRIVTPICGRYWFDQITIGSVVRTTTIGNNNDVRQVAMRHHHDNTSTQHLSHDQSDGVNPLHISATILTSWYEV